MWWIVVVVGVALLIFLVIMACLLGCTKHES